MPSIDRVLLATDSINYAATNLCQETKRLHLGLSCPCDPDVAYPRRKEQGSRCGAFDKSILWEALNDEVTNDGRPDEYMSFRCVCMPAKFGCYIG